MIVLFLLLLNSTTDSPLSVRGVSSQRFFLALGVAPDPPPPGVSLPGVVAPGVA